MAKKILVLCGSSRKGGNTDILAQAFIKGAKSSGNEVEKLNWRNIGIIYADGVEEKGSIVGREELKAAEQLGKTIH